MPQQPVAFARMIAKIGYCYAIAQLGVEALQQTFVLDAILGVKDDVGRWVGTWREVGPVDTRLLHRLALHTGPDGNLLFAEVHLFSDSESPSYVVVVGRVRKACLTRG